MSLGVGGTVGVGVGEEASLFQPADREKSCIALRARPLVTLRVRYAVSARGTGWDVAHRAATNEALAQLSSRYACFAISEARHIGVVGLEGSLCATPLAPGTCGALTAACGGNEAGDEDEDDGDEDDEAVSEASRGGKRASGCGRKGKKGFKKGSCRRIGSKAAAVAAGTPAAPPLPSGCPLSVQILWPLCPVLSASRHRAPVLSMAPSALQSPHDEAVAAIPMQLDAVVYCPRDAPLAAGLGSLQAALAAQLQRLTAMQLAAAPSSRTSAAHTARAYLFKIEGVEGLLSMLYVLPVGCDALEAPTRPLREAAHRRLGLPLDRPLLRTCNALQPGAEAWGGAGGALPGSTPIPGVLRGVHEGLAPSGVKGGRVALVQGTYEYFHYMQWTGAGEKAKPYDDCGWGTGPALLVTPCLPRAAAGSRPPIAHSHSRLAS